MLQQYIYPREYSFASPHGLLTTTTCLIQYVLWARIIRLKQNSIHTIAHLSRIETSAGIPTIWLDITYKRMTTIIYIYYTKIYSYVLRVNENNIIIIFRYVLLCLFIIQLPLLQKYLYSIWCRWQSSKLKPPTVTLLQSTFVNIIVP